MRTVLILISGLFFTQFFSACAYKPDVQQGNVVDDKQIEQLKIGMTPHQVIFLLGTVILSDPFHQNRWDYVYTYKKGYTKTQRRILTLYFEKNKLAKIDQSQRNIVTLDE